MGKNEETFTASTRSKSFVEKKILIIIASRPRGKLFFKSKNASFPHFNSLVTKTL